MSDLALPEFGAMCGGEVEATSGGGEPGGGGDGELLSEAGTGGGGGGGGEDGGEKVGVCASGAAAADDAEDGEDEDEIEGEGDECTVGRGAACALGEVSRCAVTHLLMRFCTRLLCWGVRVIAPPVKATSSASSSALNGEHSDSRPVESFIDLDRERRSSVVPDGRLRSAEGGGGAVDTPKRTRGAQVRARDGLPGTASAPSDASATIGCGDVDDARATS